MDALDRDLIPLLEPFLREDYAWLASPPNDAQRHAFIDGTLCSPELSYPLLSGPVITHLTESWRCLYFAVYDHPSPVVRHAYGKKLNELWAMVELLEAARRGADKAAHRASVKMYGAPEMQYFGYCMRELSKQVRQASGSVRNERVQTVADRLLPQCAAYEKLSFSWDVIPFPQEMVDTGPALTATEIQALQEEMIRDAGLAEDIKVEIRTPTGKTTFEFDKERCVSIIPADEDLAMRTERPTEMRMQALCMHEVLVHGGRRVRGLKSGLALLGMGLAGYLSGEEGVAKYYEQRILGMRGFEVQSSYLAVALAVGLDGTPRAFRELYEILVDTSFIGQIDRALYHHEAIDLDSFERKAQASAWGSALSVFRGTTGKTPGACFTKGLVYLPGNIKVWQLVTVDPKREETFLLGKYDPCNEDHLEILRELNLL